MNTNEPDYYEILQVSPGAEQEVIEAAYRRLARKYHPDINTDPSAASRMTQLNAAFDVLGDPARRAAYDSRRYNSTYFRDEPSGSDEDEDQDDEEADESESEPYSTPYTPIRPTHRYSWWQVAIIALGLAIGIPTAVIALRDASKDDTSASPGVALHSSVASTVPIVAPTLPVDATSSVGWDAAAVFSWTLAGLELCNPDPSSLDPLRNESQRNCIEGYMTSGGATANAVEFFDETGVFLVSFSELGHVDVGNVGAPWWDMGRPTPALLNGIPALMTADSILTPIQLQMTPPPWPEYATVSGSQSTANGGQTIELSYPLRSCRACQTVGSLVLKVEIAADGHLAGTTVEQ